MKLFITGAGGFLGSAVRDCAVARGHEVSALVRKPTASDHPNLTYVDGDLRAPGAWTEALAGHDAVIHLAAAKSGDLATQFAGSVLSTEVLLTAMAAAQTLRLVHVSSFVVYDFDAVPSGATIDESTPLEDNPRSRDEYTQAKLLQERIVREWAATEHAPLTVLRPGAVWATDEHWDGGQAMSFGRLGLAVAPHAALKLTHVENCAEAIVLAAERPESIGTTLNIVDDNPPTAVEFSRALAAAGIEVPLPLPVPFVAFRALGSAIQYVNTRRFGGTAKVPGLFVPSKLDPRFKPFKYPNSRAREVLHWNPRSLSTLLAEGSH